MEYAGYVSPEKAVDWQALSSQMAEKIYGIGTRRTAEKEALDQSARDLEKIVNDPSIMGKSQTFNTMILDGADNARKNIYSWNKDLKAGKITPKEYKEKLTSLQDNWGILASSAKTFDERYQEAMKRQEEGVASNLELEFLDQYGQMANITDKKIQVSQDGRVYMAKVDPNTGQVIGNVEDTRALNLPENIQVNKVDVAGTTESLTEGWDPWTIWKDMGRGGEMTVTDIRENNEVFGPMKAKVAESIAPNSNPRAQVSVLVDNGVLTDAAYYYDDNDYKAKRQELIDDAIQIKKTAGQANPTLTDEEIRKLETNLIKLQKEPNGVINPVLTPEQQKLAKDRVMQEVEIRMERKVTGSPKQQWSTSTGGNGGGDGTKDEEMKRGYVAAAKAFGIDPFKTKETGSVVYSGTSDFGGLSKSYQYRRTGKGIEIYNAGDLDPNTNQPVKKGDKGVPATPIRIAKTPADLAQYVFNGEPANAGADFEKARNLFYGGNAPKSGGGNSGSKPKAY